MKFSYLYLSINWLEWLHTPSTFMLKLHISKQNGRCNDVSKIMNFWIIFFSIHISLPTTVLCYWIMLEYIWHTSFFGFSSLFFFCVCFPVFFPIFFSFRRRVFCSWFFFRQITTIIGYKLCLKHVFIAFQNHHIF